MHDLALEEISDRRQTNVRMRPHVHAAWDAWLEIDRSHVIEEDERSHHSALRKGQHAANLEAAEVAAPLWNHELDHGFGLLGRAARFDYALHGDRQQALQRITPQEFELRPGGRYSAHPSPEMQAMGLPETMIDGEVIECVPHRRLVQTYRWLFSEGNKAEGFTRVTWELETNSSGFTRLTVIHDELEGAPMMAAGIKSKFNEHGGGGWNWILSDLKTLLETGKTLGE